ncbi:hypothetical protein DAPPUDRAFT_331101 [Daphnia pulex]|uniref:Uncharacterized protein n=1 Tax=Daphnia pulex TaxID=6669 RepID=E9HLH5_DAPPU|nr:hypothetical protein DAPPUDRAFT_331101 [Daphnia pulex]|eukprot:EFX67349.1 hypothetical protein DAPPUDRAFT_331101 [Daphnia pulex]
MLLTSTSARSSLSRKPTRLSVLIEEDKGERSSQKALTSPLLMKFGLYEDVDTVSLSNEDVNLDIYDED